MTKRSAAGGGSGGGSGRRASMLLKFSNTSVTAARASRARNSIDITEYQANSSNSAASSKRRKFFNSSTELFHILGLILMSLCRKVTNVGYLNRRLAVYTILILIGGVLHDFTPILVRALLPAISPRSSLNWLFVKYGGVVAAALLTPLIALSCHALRRLHDIDLDAVEKSIERYHERRIRALMQAQQHQQQPPQPQSNSSSSSSGNINMIYHNNNNNNNNNHHHHHHYSIGEPKIITLQALSSIPLSANMIDDYQHRLFATDFEFCPRKPLTTEWMRAKACVAIEMFRCKDLCRLLICGTLYVASICCFGYIHIATKPIAAGAQSGSAKNNAVINASHRSAAENRSPSGANLGLDISGHVFILIFSNLIFVEECNIMSGWEPLADRLFDLSRECLYLDIDASTSPLQAAISFAAAAAAGNSSSGDWSATTRRLVCAWNRFRRNTGKLRVVFAAAAALTIVWDFMLLQTACHYHTLIEKTIAAIFAIACWFVAYRVVFPPIGLDVRRTATLAGETTGGARS